MRVVISRRKLFTLFGSVAAGSAAAVVVGPPSGVAVSAAALRAYDCDSKVEIIVHGPIVDPDMVAEHMLRVLSENRCGLRSQLFRK